MEHSKELQSKVYASDLENDANPLVMVDNNKYICELPTMVILHQIEYENVIKISRGYSYKSAW